MNFFPSNHNWHEERGNSLVKAKRLVAMSERVLLKISEQTGIDYQMLLNYHSEPEKLEYANWKTVDALGRAYDYFELIINMQPEDTLSMQSILENMFADLNEANYQDPQIVRLLAKMKHIITSDPMALYELFKAYTD